MRVLLTGANGFLGSAIAAHLRADGHAVTGVVRSKRAGSGVAADRIVTLDIAEAADPEDWVPHLEGIDAVVNCAGVHQDAPGESVRGVHVTGIAALYAACERSRVRRVIHISAIGVDRAQPSEFSRSKAEGEQALTSRDLDWVILRPSVVVGRAAYGGSALFRGLAALPILPVMPGTGLLQIVQLEDVVRTVSFFLAPDAPSKIAIELAGPERLSFTDVVLAYRRWLGWSPPRRVKLPKWGAAIAYRVGDFLGLLGWRPPIRSTAALEMVRGAIGDPGEWQRLTGIRPLSLSEALASEPASVQERWFAQLYFVKPLAFIVFALFWISTGLISLGPGWNIGKSLMFEGDVDEPLATLAVVAGALADIAIGLAIAWRRTAWWGLLAALSISITYAVIGTILVPRLWADPLGPMLKIWPIITLEFALLAILRDR